MIEICCTYGSQLTVTRQVAVKGEVLPLASPSYLGSWISAKVGELNLESAKYGLNEM